MKNASLLGLALMVANPRWQMSLRVVFGSSFQARSNDRVKFSGVILGVILRKMYGQGVREGMSI